MTKRTEKAEFIQEFIEFCYTDLDNLTMYERYIWARSLSEVMGFLPGEFFISTKDESVSEKEWKRVKETQEELFEGLNWLYAKYMDASLAKISIRIYVPRMIYASHYFGYTGSQHVNEPIIIKIFKFGEYDFSDENAIERKSLPECFDNIMKALAKFPTSSLRRCLQCQKIFFNPTKREKIYCRPRCQNTAAVQRFRTKEN